MITPDPTDASSCLLALKVVPGSSKDQIVGIYGDRLKVKVAAPPQDGQANARVCAILAEALGVAARAMTIVAGATSHDKIVHAHGVSAEAARARLL